MKKTIKKIGKQKPTYLVIDEEDFKKLKLNVKPTGFKK